MVGTRKGRYLIMPSATIETLDETQTTNFQLDVEFDEAVPDFADRHLRLYKLRDNGTKDVEITISGMSTEFTLAVALPSMKIGAFALSIGGMTIKTVGSQMVSESLTSNVVFVAYDTTDIKIKLDFGELEYRENGEIILPATFDENVIVLAKTTFFVRHVSGNIDGVDYIILGENKEFELVFDVPATQKGSFRVDPSGQILKVDTQTHHSIIGTPKLIPFGY